MTETLLNYISLGWMSMAVLLFPVLLKVKAPFGRHSSGLWGPVISNRLAWVIMESPALLVFSLLFFSGGQEKNLAHWLLYGFWMCHYINRTLIYPFRIKTKNKKMPVLVMGSAIFFQLVNGSLNGLMLGSFSSHLSTTWLYSWQFYLGFALAIGGMIVNLRSDEILISLRKPGETSYKIPKGFLYRYISCPNFLGEIIEWAGWAIASWSLAGASFAVWTAANLIPRALDHHHWYREHFEDYPQERKALVPGII